MSNKPFPFSVCKDCCATGGGTDNEYVNQNFANAVKGTATGRIGIAPEGLTGEPLVCVEDVSPIEHDMSISLSDAESSNYTDMIVTVRGANMVESLNKNYDSGDYEFGINITFNKDGSAVLNGTANQLVLLFVSVAIYDVDGVYTVSGITGGSEETYYLEVVVNRNESIQVYDNTTVNIAGEITRVAFVMQEGAVLNNVVINPRIEQRVPETYTPDENGNVFGVRSFYPTFEIYVDYDGDAYDLEGLLATVEYNKDSNKDGIAELIETITADGSIRIYERNEEASGNLYNFKSMYIHIARKPTVSNRIEVYFYYGSKLLCTYQFINTVGNNGFMSIHADVIGGMWQAIATSATSQGVPTNVQMWGENLVPYSGETINRVVIKGASSAVAADATIKIYGVRA